MNETKKNKPILFLDIDGVMNSIQYAIRTKENGIWGVVAPLDPDCVAQLQRIIDATNCHIVITSTWRRLYDITELKAKFVVAGLRDADCFIGVTPVHPYGCEYRRGHEIHRWIEAYDKENCYKLKYVCVDDDSDFFSTQPLVCTNAEVGLTKDDADKIIAALS